MDLEIKKDCKCPDPRCFSRMEDYHRAYEDWYIHTHPYIALPQKGGTEEKAKSYTEEKAKSYMSWISLKTWFPVMEPGYMKNIKSQRDLRERLDRFLDA